MQKIRGTKQFNVRVDFYALFRKLLEKQGFKPLKKVYQEDKTEYRDEQDGNIEAPNKIFVDWGDAVVANKLALLGTDGLGVCAALKVIDPTSNNQAYLLHALPQSTPADEIKKSLGKATSLGINLRDSEIDRYNARLCV